ncbi:MAG: hypothetical protein H6Q95_453 [Nitrospirae bacterium]|nr:hypothetical protein [Nitrospirota bacterium]
MKRDTKNRRHEISNRLQLLFFSPLLVACFLFSSCGYHIVGSKYLAFDSIAVRPVQNLTYAPRLKEKLQNALSRELITQGINIVPADRPDTLGTVPDRGIVLEARITTFELRAIAAVGEQVKEQEIIMLVDVTIMDKNTVSELKAVKSPLQITYQATGTVSDAEARKEVAIDKACTEIAKEITDRVIMKYVK